MTNDEINARISDLAEMVYRVVCADNMPRAEKQAEVDRLIDRMLQLDARRTVEVAS